MNASGSSVRSLAIAVAAVGGITIVYGLVHLNAVAFARFVQEDHLAENATFAAWLTATVILAHRLATDRHWRRPGCVLLALLCLVVAMEEISWGQRLLSIKPPEMIRETNLQQEFTLHNFVILPDYYPLAGAGIVAWWLLSLLARPRAALGAFLDRLGAPRLPGFLLPVFLAAAWFSLPNRWIALPERDEAFELFLGIATLLLVVFMPGNTRSGRTLATSSLAVAVIAAGVFVIHPPGEMSRRHVNFLAGYRFAEVGLFEPSRELFEYALARPALIGTETRLDYGRVLRRTGAWRQGREVLAEALAAEYALARGIRRTPEASRRRGILLDELREPDRARRTFEFAFERHAHAIARKKTPSGRHNAALSAVVTRLASGDFTSAEREFERVDALAPTRRQRLIGRVIYDFERRRALAYRQ